MAIRTLCSDRVRMAIHFFVKFDINFENGCILLIGSIYTKLGDFVKLGLHFMTILVLAIPEVIRHVSFELTPTLYLLVHLKGFYTHLSAIRSKNLTRISCFNNIHTCTGYSESEKLVT